MEVVGGAALPRAEALWVLDQVLLGAAEAEGGAVAEAVAEEAGAEAAEVAEVAGVDGAGEGEVEEAEEAEEVEEVEAAEEGVTGGRGSGCAGTTAEAAVTAPFTALSEAEQAARAEVALLLLGELLRPGVWHGTSVWHGGDGVAARRSALLERELLLQALHDAKGTSDAPRNAPATHRQRMQPFTRCRWQPALRRSSAAPRTHRWR